MGGARASGSRPPPPATIYLSVSVDTSTLFNLFPMGYFLNLLPQNIHLEDVCYHEGMSLWTLLLPSLPESTTNWLNIMWFGNAVGDYLQALIFSLVLTIVFAFIRRMFVWRLREAASRSNNSIDDLVCDLAQEVRAPLFIVLAFTIVFQTLNLPVQIESVLTTLTWISATSIVILMLQQVVDYLVEKSALADESSQRISWFRNLGALLKVVFWALGALLILSNIGINVYSLIAGLGVSGIIVAFALQNVLQDLFDSLAINFDRPFEVGDFIVVKDYLGTVEKVGLKSTRIRALSGEQIIIPNSELTNSQIKNYRRMERRRIELNFQVAIETPNSKLKKIPSAVQKIIDDIEQTTFNRVHLADIGEYGLNYVAIYHIEDSDYTLFRDVHQQVLLELKAYLEREKIDIPYPSQRIMVQK